MNIFINSIKIIKFIINKNNDTYLYYAHIADEDLSFLQSNIKYINFKSIHGNITYKNFSFEIIDNIHTDFNDIKILLNNKKVCKKSF